MKKGKNGNIDQLSFAEEPTEIAKISMGGEKVFDSGVSVNLAERAFELCAADKANSGYLRASGFEHALNSPYRKSIRGRFNDEQIRRIAGSQQSYIDDFHLHMIKAYGLDKIVSLGGVKPEVAEGWEKSAERGFINKFDGPEGKKARTQYLRAWKSQMK